SIPTYARCLIPRLGPAFALRPKRNLRPLGAPPSLRNTGDRAPTTRRMGTWAAGLDTSVTGSRAPTPNLRPCTKRAASAEPAGSSSPDTTRRGSVRYTNRAVPFHPLAAVEPPPRLGRTGCALAVFLGLR